MARRARRNGRARSTPAPTPRLRRSPTMSARGFTLADNVLGHGLAREPEAAEPVRALAVRHEAVGHAERADHRGGGLFERREVLEHRGAEAAVDRVLLHRDDEREPPRERLDRAGVERAREARVP